MTEPDAPPPSADAPEAEVAADPFEPGPAQLSGCGKPAVIGCLALLAMLAVGLVLLVSQGERLMVFLIRTMEKQVTAALPEDLEPAERQRLAAGFDGAVAAIEDGRFDSTSTSKLQRLSTSMPAGGETLSQEQVVEIIRLLEEIGAVGGPQGERPPAARPGVGLMLLSP